MLFAPCPSLLPATLAPCLAACSLNLDTAALLAGLSSLRRLGLDGNGVDDAVMEHVAALPLLRCAGCGHVCVPRQRGGQSAHLDDTMQAGSMGACRQPASAVDWHLKAPALRAPDMVSFVGS